MTLKLINFKHFGGHYESWGLEERSVSEGRASNIGAHETKKIAGEENYLQLLRSLVTSTFFYILRIVTSGKL